MPRNRDEMELLGFLPPRAGEDPRTSDPIDVVDNGAFRDIENLEDDFRNPVDASEDPFLPQVTDDDGVPGFRPFVDASQDFGNDLAQEKDLSEEEHEMNSVRQMDEHSDDVLGDEFKQKLSARARALLSDEGRPVSDIAALARAGNAEHEARAARQPYVNITPESAATGLLGSQVLLNTQNGSPIQVASWQGLSDAEACPVTVTLTQVIPPIPTSGGTQKPIRPYAVLEWGTRNRMRAEVDIGLGTQFTINAAAVALSVGLDVSTVLGSVDQECQLAGNLGFWPCVRTAPVTRTKYSDSLSAGGNDLIEIPAFAKNVLVSRGGNPTDQMAFTIIVTDNTGRALAKQVVAINTLMSTPLILPGASRRISLTNDGAGAVTFCLVFELGL